MSSVWVDLLLGAALLGAGSIVLMVVHRVASRVPASEDDYVAPAIIGTLVTSLLACGSAFLIRAALAGHMFREIAISAVLAVLALIAVRLIKRRSEAALQPRLPQSRTQPL